MSDYFVHETSIVDPEVSIGAGTKIWYFCHIQSGAVIGENCSLGQNVNISNNVRMGNGCKLQNNVSLYEGVELENDVFCGPSCVFTNDLTPRAKYPKGHAAYKKTLIREGASIGANATVVCGHTVGRWAMIGAGAVVTTDVPDHALMLGVPARLSGWSCECGTLLGEELRCPVCGRRYRKAENGLIEEK
ncbi:MAG: N-acetyltransferase [Oscillospiraceae bacterium]|nr:N-acetyltransferase [Oscillospiraceae bacterium]